MNPKYISKFKLKPSTWVFVPSLEFFELGKEIKSLIEKKWKAPKNYYHLRKGGHVEALKSHLNNSFFLHLDIQDFFGSISRTRVTRCLKDHFSYVDARDMANSSTVPHPETKKSILPFGFVQSPVLASLCLAKSGLGKYIRGLENNAAIAVSVYVDDIVISTKDSSILEKIYIDIKQAAEKSRFSLNDKKEEGPAHKITAFNIELSNNALAIAAQRMDQFRQFFDDAENEHQRRGIRGYVMSINESQAELLK